MGQVKKMRISITHTNTFYLLAQNDHCYSHNT
jgi:hypothetical protein